MKLHFEIIPILGVCVLVLNTLPFFSLLSDSFVPILPHTPKISAVACPEDSILPLSSTFDALVFGVGSSEITFSIDPPRPNSLAKNSGIIVRLGGQCKRLEPPAKLGLQFDLSESLQISDELDLFWLECDWTPTQEVEAALFYKTLEGEVVCKEKWITTPQDTPIDIIPVAGPFKELSGAVWWGHDLIGDKYSGLSHVQRLEIGSVEIDLSPNEWLIYTQQGWKKGEIADNGPIAHIVRAESQFLEFEGWDSTGHVRFKLPILANPPSKSKGEELFSQLRIRSEKQISCVLEKQCLILKTGDFVIKIKDRWKVLRKKEEKEALLSGKMVGDCFVLDRIDAKSKHIAGTLYSPKRTSSVPIEYTQPVKKPTQPARSK
jgi:hypothetical protein